MARHAPGLNATELERMTPEQTRYLRKGIEAELKSEREERFAYVKALVRASGGRIA